MNTILSISISSILNYFFHFHLSISIPFHQFYTFEIVKTIGMDEMVSIVGLQN